MGARDYTVNIVGLANKAHHFKFEMGDEFFERHRTDIVSQGALTADVVLDKRETFIEASFSIHGKVNLVCDRSLEAFDEPVDCDRKLVFKYGDADEELSDEIIMIHRDTEQLELGQYIFEFIALAVPMKKLHPRFRDEDPGDNPDGKIIYSSKPSEDTADDETIDPRWDILKKLK
jgi:uncharacterized protein